jgi:uncharacterized protein
VPAQFLNRETELALLERCWRSDRAEFVVLYGRRRVGKTELLVRFAEGRRALVLEATDVRTADQLRDFAGVYVDALDLGSLDVRIDSWERALGMVAEAAQTERTLVVLDEFQYLARQDTELGSLLSRWWRSVGRTLNLVLVLAGSDVTFFNDEVLGATAPLHGRRTADYRLLPFAARDAPLFTPSWGVEDHVRAFAVWGGVPHYLSLLDPDATLAENILRTTLLPGAPLQREAEYLIRMESRLRDVALYGSILRALAAGKTTPSEIAGRLGGIDVGNLTRQIERLEDVGLVRQVRPLIAARKGAVRYQIADPFLRFWFHFVAPATSRLATEERAERYLERVVLTQLDEFVAKPAFEEVCQADMLRRLDAATVGHWWGPVTEKRRDRGGKTTVEREVDGVALDDAGSVIALATCKWSRSPVGVSELNKLRRVAEAIAPGATLTYLVYTRSGVDDRLAAEHEADPDGIRIVTPADLYA